MGVILFKAKKQKKKSLLILSKRMGILGKEGM
jgi:hypothetical protein